MSQENVEIVRRIYPVLDRGRTSLPHVWNAWTFRTGKPVEWTYFGEDRAAALEAVGLSAQDISA
jgi:hypothetical protein